MDNQKKVNVAPNVPVVDPAPAAEGDKQNEKDVEKNAAPAEKVESSLPAPVTSIRRLSFNEKLVRVMAIYWDDLRIRMGVIMIFVWILNLVRSLSFLTNSSYIHNRWIVYIYSIIERDCLSARDIFVIQYNHMIRLIFPIISLIFIL